MTILKNSSRPAGRTSRARSLPLTVAEFFAGIGLMRMGLEAAGWRVVFANDIDAGKRRMYAAQFPDAEEHFVLEDAHRLKGGDVPSVTLATASFPCTDLSLAGARRGLAGAQSGAFWAFTRVLEQMKARRPPLVLLENVPGFLTSRGGADFLAAMRELNALGYAVDAFQIDAARFVPQSRARLFVVGRQGGDGSAPPDTTAGDPSRPPALRRFIASHPEIRWSLHPLPPPPERSLTLPDILEDLPDDAPEWWSAERAAYLLSQMSPAHRRVADDMIRGNEWRFGTVFRRVRNGKSMAELRVDGLAGCLRTPKGGSGRQILFAAGRGRYRARLLTPRECARLMGADDFKIDVPANQALFGFGDAVCVPVVKWIAEHCLTPAAKALV